MLLFVFSGFPRSTGACYRAQGLIYCPSQPRQWWLPLHEEHFTDFGYDWARGRAFWLIFSGKLCALEITSCIFHPIISQLLAPALPLIDKSLHFSSTSCSHVFASRANRNLLQQGLMLWGTTKIQEVRSQRMGNKFIGICYSFLGLFLQISAWDFEPMKYSVGVSSWVHCQPLNVGLLWYNHAEHQKPKHKMEPPLMIFLSIHNQNN